MTRSRVHLLIEMMVCAWCDAPILSPADTSARTVLAAPATSHGLCTSCRQALLAAAPAPRPAPAFAGRWR